jgi:hypothetical protein
MNTSIKRRFRYLCLSLPLLLCGALPAQTFNLTPASPSVGPGGTVQFNAQPSGLAPGVTVNWSAGGVFGGNATVGTVGTGGLYTAPLTPPAGGTVRIVAAASDGSVSQKTTVYLLAAGPTITSVSPNPVPQGSFTVTVQGSGFQTGATVFNAGVQLATSQVTSTSLTATGYQAAAASTSFCVQNPGTSCGNSLTVPVAGPTSGGGGSGSGSGGSSTAPVLTSVTPNPLPVGNDTVTIQGTGFQPGASVYESYGTLSMIQYASATQSPTAVTASIYQGAATTATFCVKNPGSACSNSITVPVSGSSTGGSGGGTGSGGGSTPTAPVLTSVTPNPLAVGNDTVTIQGMGFQPGALVYDSYGTVSLIQYASSSVTATTVTAAIYQGPATSSTFCVKNPGSACSNSITVPVSGTSGGSGGSGGGNGGGGTTYTLTVVNGTGSGSYAAGIAVPIAANTPPTGQAFQAWTGFAVAGVQSVSTTVTMPAANITVTANYYTPAPIPFPVTTHPRLWITQQDLPHLQQWAVPSNLAYQGQSGALYAAIGNYSAAFPNAALNAVNPTPASPYPDFGDTQGYTGMLSEENAVILALNSLIDPSPANRAQYAQAARNLLMYAMNQAALGHANNLPFRDPSFAIYNRGSFTGHEWPLIVDWIYPILSPADKATIRSVFMMWANDCLAAETTGGDNPGLPGLENSLALLPNNLPYRFASNNYFLAHARLLTMMSLVLDPADDAPINPALPAGALGNTLRSYIADATGAWLYEEFAMMGDAATVAQAYNVPNNPTGAGFGLASGGLPPEGMLYGESFGYILGQLLALQTAGFNNVAFSGPQIGMIGAPVWDRYVTGFISSLTPTSKVFPSETWNGSVYQFAGYGDLLRTFVTPDFMTPFALLGLLDQETGSSEHVNAARWFVVNAPPNGADGLLTRMTNPWTWGVTQDLLYYLLLDPGAPAATDPRPAFPTLFYDAGQSRILAHTDWTPNGTLFDYRASWTSINHQDGMGGQFELFRKGEWLTKEMSNYDNGGNGVGATVTYHNSLGLQNWCQGCPPFTQGPDAGAWSEGGQWMEGENAGDPTTVTSSGPGYVYATSNLTNLYNHRGTEIVDITQAVRNIVWVNNDWIVVYDRATSQHNGFKRFNLSLATNPVIFGNTATETLASGQQLFVQTLLPQNPSMTSFNGVAELSSTADLEPMQYIYQVQDPSNALDTRFLHVLQGADSGVPVTPAAYLTSTGATPFDGAAFGNTEVWFPVSTNNAFAGATFPAAAGIHTALVTGLTANAGYTVIVQPNGAGSTIAVQPGGNNMADAAGVLRIAF